VSRSYVPAALRRLVRTRAEGHCEYCLIREEDTFFGCEIDHVVSEKHGGATDPRNLALACLICNRNKGSDVGTLLPDRGRFSRFYHPRSDRWLTHFRIPSERPRIPPLTDPGSATERVLALNSAERLLERTSLRHIGHYPPPPSLLHRFGRDLD
jgi:hypothetical protein